MTYKILLFFFILMLLPLSVSAVSFNDTYLYYGFDVQSGTNIIDLTDNINATRFNSPTNASGIIGSSLNFDATNERVISNALLGISGNQARTLNMWLYWNGTGQYSIFGSWGALNNNQLFGLASDNAGQLYFVGYGTGDYDTNTNIPLNQWVMITATFSGLPDNKVNTYINAVPTSVTNQTKPLNTINGRLFIASRPDNSTGSNFRAGRIDEVGVWNRALNSTELTALYNSGAGLQYPFSTTGYTPNLENITFRLYNNDTSSYVPEYTLNYNANSTIVTLTTKTLELDTNILYNISFIPSNTSLYNASYTNQNLSGLTFFTGFTSIIPAIPINYSNVSFSAIDGNNDTITGFSVSINSGEYLGSTTGTNLIISIPDTELSTELFNLTYSKFNYYTSSYTNINLTGLNHTGTLVAKTYAGDESLDDKSVIWIIFALVGMVGIASIFSRPMLIVFGFSIMFFTYFLSGNIMISYYWFAPLGYILGAVVILTGMLRLGFGEKF